MSLLDLANCHICGCIFFFFKRPSHPPPPNKSEIPVPDLKVEEKYQPTGKKVDVKRVGCDRLSLISPVINDLVMEAFSISERFLLHISPFSRCE